MNTTCFRYRPPDSEPIADPPKLERLGDADRDDRSANAPDSSIGLVLDTPDGTVEIDSIFSTDLRINAPPVTLQPKDTARHVEEAIQAASETVTVDPNIGGFHRGATLEPCPEPVNDPGEPVVDTPRHAAFRAVLMLIQPLSKDDALKVLAAASAHRELD